MVTVTGKTYQTASGETRELKPHQVRSCLDQGHVGDQQERWVVIRRDTDENFRAAQLHVQGKPYSLTDPDVLAYEVCPAFDLRERAYASRPDTPTLQQEATEVAKEAFGVDESLPVAVAEPEEDEDEKYGDLPDAMREFWEEHDGEPGEKGHEEQFECSSCGVVCKCQIDKKDSWYECGECGTEFSRFGQGEGSNRCPDCGSMASKSDEGTGVSCPECQEAVLEEIA